DVLASTVGGDLSLVARHGRVDIQEVQGRATVDSEHGDVSAARTGGLVVRASFGEVGVEGVRGDLEVRSQHGPVTARDVSGAAWLKVAARSRSVPAGPPEPGEIRVNVPGLWLTSTTAGVTKGEFGGGGSAVHLQARHGDVLVQAAATAAAKNP